MFKGNSPSPKLFKLIVDSNECTMKYCFVIYAIHVSESRMIQQGTDGVSRGKIKQGLMIDKPIREFVLIDMLALDHNTA